jgi:5-methylcytosine-specific restriction endonuclease McrA
MTQTAEEKREYNARWRRENPDKRREQRRRRDARNPDYRRKAKARYRAKNPEAKRASDMRRYQRNPAAFTAHCANRRAAKTQATPEWLTPTQRLEMLAWYALGRMIGREVDHIVPLKGKLVCGLHVPWNLQLLTKAENSAKNNRL